MAENSTIEWTHHTFNPWIGCQKVGPGCDHCYAEAMMATRLGRVEWGPHAARQKTSTAYWKQPLTWDRKAAAAGERNRVFCASLADWADTHPSIQPEWRAALGRTISATPNLTWLLVTKRIGNAEKVLAQMFPAGVPANVAIGITVVNQAEADRDIPKLLELKAKLGIRWVFLSIEPMLGPVDLTGIRPDDETGTPWDELSADLNEWGVLNALHAGPWPCLDWVIVGGESGPGARVWPGFADAARSLRDQCRAAGVAFFMKQMAGPRKSAMPPIPDDLMVREFPNG